MTEHGYILLPILMPDFCPSCFMGTLSIDEDQMYVRCGKCDFIIDRVEINRAYLGALFAQLKDQLSDDLIGLMLDEFANNMNFEM